MKLEILDERLEIEKVIIHLFIKTDEKDWNAVNDCFHSEVLFDMTSMAGGAPVTLNPTEITSAWDEGLKEVEHVHHQIGNLLIDIIGAEAKAFCYGTASHYKKTDSGNDTRTFIGSYDIGLIKENGAWQINALKFNLKFIDGNADLSN